MSRLFIAAWPSDSVVDALGELTRTVVFDEPGVRLVPPENWHVTLRFLGDAPADRVVDRLGAARLPAATVSFGPAVERLGRGQLVVPASGVDGLAAAVREATDGLGSDERRRFFGHLTIARTKQQARSSLLGAPFAATMDIDEVALVASTLAPTGAEYETLARFPTTPLG